MRISANFDGGNIDVINTLSPDNIELAIRPDEGNAFFQWFNFKLNGTIGVHYQLHILNADKASYPEGWENYQAAASYDREHWFRLPTRYENGRLTIDVELDCDSIQIAYFAPYSYERHQDLLAKCQVHPMVTVEHLGLTLDKRDLSLVRIGDGGEAKANVWITARQHPGETMAQWLVEGLMSQLLDTDNPVSRALLAKANFYIVPNMNPDGGVRGHLRTNALGVNLNREWQSPSLEKSPEVFHVVNKMRQTGVDLFYDVHGDEGLPYVFLAGSEGVPRFDAAMATLQHTFEQALRLASPDFQTQFGYDKDEPGQANLTVASNWVAQEFGCLSYTLEMPFKDNDDLAEPIQAWSPERSMLLGEASLVAMNAVLNKS